MDNYQKLVASLVKPGQDILNDITPDSINLWHMATGICGEAGELLDAIKKVAVYNKNIDLENVIEELGDLEFYMEGLRQALDLDREAILKYNYDKLNKRYPSGSYSNKDAQERKDKI